MLACMDEEPRTTAELFEAWRDATRAAELADRLAALAAQAAEEADVNAVASEELALMAQATSEAAARAADRARDVSQRARARAQLNRDQHLPDAGKAVAQARAMETAARDRFQGQEAQVGDGSGRAEHGQP